MRAPFPWINITNRFLNRNVDPPIVDEFQALFDAQPKDDKENDYLNKLLSQLTEVKERGKALRRITRPRWWEKPMDELSLEAFKPTSFFYRCIP